MLSNSEIEEGVLNDSDGTPPLQKLYSCLTTSEEQLTDGEIIDMCRTYIEGYLHNQSTRHNNK